MDVKREKETGPGAGAKQTIFELGPFRLDLESGVLSRLGVAEPLGERAVRVLATLVSEGRHPVSKEAIFQAAWPGRVVEESNLSVQIAAIRRVLAHVPGGDRWIETLARRGYRFIGPVRRLADDLLRDEAPPGNLPVALTTFVGREHELVELKRLLARNRLLTLAGIGGIGKTRLAIQLAEETCDAFRDGVHFIDFGSIEQSDLVPSVVAQVLGVQESGPTPTDALRRHLSTQRTLMIFDNCEHVLDAAARLAEAILLSAREATIIATTREPLRISGEQVYRIPTLSVPGLDADNDSIGRSDAVRLFVDRAQHQQHDFALMPDLLSPVAELCVRLDGIPFALELAAALVPSHSVDEINSRLNDRFGVLVAGTRTAPKRQQTLRATLDWSHDLLSDAERRVFRRASLFLGGFTAEAGGAVAGDNAPDAQSIAGTLERLVQRSLLAADETDDHARYRMLETTRAYAREKLDGANETSVTQRRHAAHMLNFFSRATDDWLRLTEAEWRGRYVPELDNVRSALDWSLAAEGDPSMAVALAGASGPLWTTLSLYAEGIRRLEAAVRQIRVDTAKNDEARLWLWLGSLLEPSTPSRTVDAFERTIALGHPRSNEASLALARVWHARVLATIGRFDSSAAVLKEATPALRRLRIPKLLGVAEHNSGYLKLMTGDATGARQHYETARSHFREAGHEFGLIGSTSNLGNLSWAAGDLEAAESAFREAIDLWRQSASGKKNALGFALMNLAGVLIERGKLDEALEVAREGAPMLRDIGSAWIFMDHLALCAARLGRMDDAARLAGFADALHGAKHASREPSEARACEKVRSLLQYGAVLAVDDLRREGARMTEAEACRLALDE